MNDNPKVRSYCGKISEKKRLAIPEYFDGYICHHYQPNFVVPQKVL